MNLSPSQRGSAIIMLFVAVALFGAVTYAFMRGSGNSVAMMSDEQAKVYAQQIIAYGNDVKMAVKRLQLRGVPESQINFYTDIYKNGSDTIIILNNTTSTTSSQNVFTVDGGGIKPFIAPFGAMDDSSTFLPTYPLPGHYYVRSIEVVGTKSTANDMVLVLQGVNPKVCEKIHELLGITPTTSLPNDSNAGWSSSYWLFGGTAIYGDEASYIVGKKAFCATNSGPYSYFQVLVDR